MAQSFTLADGQLAAASTTILPPDDSATPGGRYVNLSLFNTSQGGDETIILTVARGAGTARVVGQVTLGPREQRLVGSIALSAGDTLAGYASDASTVDYIVTLGVAGRMSGTTLDATGTDKGTSVLRKIQNGIEDMVGTDLVDPG